MALVDDIEFFGRATDAGDMPREQAAQALAEASRGGLTLLGAEDAIANWQTARSRYERLAFDACDTMRALENGRPIPEHVRRHGRDLAWQMIRRNPPAS